MSVEIKTKKKKKKNTTPLSQITRENKNKKSLENKMKTLISEPRKILSLNIYINEK